MTKNNFIYALKTCGCLYHNGQTYYEENELIRTFEDMEMFEEDKALSQEPCDDVEHIDYQDDFETASKKIHDYEERQKQNDKRCGDCKLIGTDTCYMVCGGSKSLYKPKQKSEPCDDAISRDMALEKMADYVASGYADSAEDFEEYSRIICQLPPVTHKQKTGHREYNDIYDHYLCGNCKTVVMDYDNYCPNCGAKMESEVRNDH